MSTDSLATDGFLTVPEACQFLGLSRSKLYELTSANAIKGVARFGRAVRIPRRALIEYAEQQMAVPQDGND